MAFIALIVSIYRGYKKSLFERQRYLFFSGRITVLIFTFLFTESMLFRIICDKRGLFSFSQLSMCKRIAKSLHFAANALTSPGLYDLTGYTGDILRWLESSFGACSAAYITTGIVLMVAPLSTAAWIVSLLNSSLWETITLIRYRLFNNSFFVFFDTSDLSISVARHLKKHLKKNELLVFCRFFDDIEEKSKEELEDIYEVADLCLSGTERQYQFGKQDNQYILCTRDKRKVYDYITLNYVFPQNIGKLAVISKEQEENINLAINASVSHKYSKEVIEKTVCPVSYLETIVDDLCAKINNIKTCVFVTDEWGGQMLIDKIKNNIVEGCDYRIIEESDTDQTDYHTIRDGLFLIKKSPYSILEYAFNILGSIRDMNNIVMAYTDVEKNIQQKRFFVERIKMEKEISIMVYCNDNRKSAEEKLWDEAIGMSTVSYFGEDELIIENIVEKYIKIINRHN